MFSNLSVAKRLAIGFGTLVALLLAVVGVALWSMANMRASTVEINTNWLPSVETLGQLNTAKSEVRVAQWRHISSTDPKAMADVEQRLNQRLGELDKARETYAKLISTDEERKIYDGFTADWKRFMAIHDKMLAHSRANENEEAKKLMLGESLRLYDGATAVLNQLIDLNHRVR